MEALNSLIFSQHCDQQIRVHGCLDDLIKNCQDASIPVEVKSQSILMLSHLALNKESLQILIDKNVFSLFGGLKIEDCNRTMSVNQENLSWIFLALCNNGIEGKQMLHKGITKDMFLISCQSDKSEGSQVRRDLVIAGFTGLGKDAIGVNDRCKINNPIQDSALNGAYKEISKNSQRDIESLILFSISEDKDK